MPICEGKTILQVLYCGGFYLTENHSLTLTGILDFCLHCMMVDCCDRNFLDLGRVLNGMRLVLMCSRGLVCCFEFHIWRVGGIWGVFGKRDIIEITENSDIYDPGFALKTIFDVSLCDCEIGIGGNGKHVMYPSLLEMKIYNGCKMGCILQKVSKSGEQEVLRTIASVQHWLFIDTPPPFCLFDRWGIWSVQNIEKPGGQTPMSGMRGSSQFLLNRKPVSIISLFLSHN